MLTNGQLLITHWASPDFNRGQRANCSLVMQAQAMSSQYPCSEIHRRKMGGNGGRFLTFRWHGRLRSVRRIAASGRVRRSTAKRSAERSGDACALGMNRRRRRSADGRWRNCPRNWRNLKRVKIVLKKEKLESRYRPSEKPKHSSLQTWTEGSGGGSIFIALQPVV